MKIGRDNLGGFCRSKILEDLVGFLLLVGIIGCLVGAPSLI